VCGSADPRTISHIRALSENEKRHLQKSTHKETPIGVSNVLFKDQDFLLYGFAYFPREFLMLACIARQLPTTPLGEHISKYIGWTVSSLGLRVRRREIDAYDALVANTLAWVVYSTCSHETEAHIHFNGSMGMLMFFMSSNKYCRGKKLLTIFGPFIIDCANAWATRHAGIPRRCTTFEQRVKYFDELFRMDPAGTWYSSILEATNATLGNLMEISLRTVYDVARTEKEGIFARNGVEEALEYVRAELGDVELQNGLRTIYRSFQGARTNHVTVEGQLITRIFHRLRCVLLLLVILEAPDIQLGVSSPKAQELARIVLSFCRLQSIQRDGPIEDYYLISWHNFTHILLGGMALATNEHPNCKDSHEIY
jgi:hypothetical protein